MSYRLITDVWILTRPKVAYYGARPPKDWREVAVIAVGCGRSQRARWFTVWEKVCSTSIDG